MGASLICLNSKEAREVGVQRVRESEGAGVGDEGGAGLGDEGGAGLSGSPHFTEEWEAGEGQSRRSDNTLQARLWLLRGN